MSFDTAKGPRLLRECEPGIYRPSVELPRELFKPRRYFINGGLSVPQGEIFDRAECAVEFELSVAGEYAAVASYAPQRRGVVAFNGNWKIECRTFDIRAAGGR